jgi:hypothetical protein
MAFLSQIFVKKNKEKDCRTNHKSEEEDLFLTKPQIRYRSRCSEEN